MDLVYSGVTSRVMLDHCHASIQQLAQDLTQSV